MVSRNGHVRFINPRSPFPLVGLALRTSAYLRPLASAIVIISFLLMAAGSATTYQVSSNLQAAINAAQPGDTILVAPGTYGKIFVPKSLNLIGEGALIKPSEHEIGIEIRADKVNVSGFTVRGGLYGIHLVESDGCAIFSNTVTGCEQWGIGLIFSDRNAIKGNVASFNGLGGEGWYGIYLSNSNENLIEENVANDNGEYGVCMFPSCSENVIIENVMERNDYGIYMFTGCAGNRIESNELSENKNSGLKMMHDCVDNLILNNTVARNDVAGVFLDLGSKKNVIQNNEIINNCGSGGVTFGIQMQEGSGNNIIVQNNITGSQKGIFVTTDGNHIYNNWIFENVIQAEDRGVNKWWDAYPVGGNFWGDYGGKDEMGGPAQNATGCDGFGDDPYWIDEKGLVRDRFPIMGPSSLPLTLIDWTVFPARAQVGDQIEVEVSLDSKYGVASISARVHNILKPSGYNPLIRMTMASEDIYKGSLQTAVMDSGRYEIVLTAKDIRGNEIEESLGELELLPRSGWNINSAIS